jgi:hypothetical protein
MKNLSSPFNRLIAYTIITTRFQTIKPEFRKKSFSKALMNINKKEKKSVVQAINTKKSNVITNPQ